MHVYTCTYSNQYCLILCAFASTLQSIEKNKKITLDLFQKQINKLIVGGLHLPLETFIII